MRRLLALFALPVLMHAGSPPDAKPFDAEEISSLGELAAAVAERVAGIPRKSAGGSYPAAETKRLAIVPADAGLSDMVSELAHLMDASGRVAVLDPAKTDALARALPSGKDPVAELGRAFDLDAVATLRGYPSAGRTLILMRIYAVSGGGRPETIFAVMAPSAATIGSMRGGAAAIRTPAVEHENMPDLPVTARYYRAADLDGDGAREYVFSDGRSLSIYRKEAGGWRLLWVEPRTAMTKEGRHVHLDAADIDGNGKEEVFATVLGARSVSTLVLEEEDGAYRQKADLPGFIRTIPFPGPGPLLIGQGYQEERMFVGAVRQFAWSEGGYRAGDALALPKGVSLYGFVAADVGEAYPLIVAFDDADRLSVYSRGELIWRSEEQYGNAKTELVGSSPDIYNIRQRIDIPAGIAAADIDGDGKAEIIVTKITEKKFGEVRKTEIRCLRWTGARLERVLTVSDVPGTVLDFQAGRRGRDGLVVIEALVSIPGGVISKPRLRLKTYSIR